MEPCGELEERTGPQLVAAAGAIDANLNEAGGTEDREVTRDAGLVDPDSLDDLTHGLLATAECGDDTSPCRICKRLKHIVMRHNAYA